MGDAVFAEFGSSVDALNCAIRIQEKLKEYNHDKGEDERILVRIGLHEGDVIVRGDDLFGEGVNVAARLEPLADPGGICISEALYQSVRNATKIEAVRVGDVELKNILQKYTIYKIPSLYHFVMYSARKIKAVFDGNAVVLSGNYMYIRKLMKVIRSFESVA